MLNLVLFGPPGAGKGTQSKKLTEKYNLIHLSTGDLLRSEIERGTSLGIQAKSIMDKGELVSDHIVIGMIENKLDENKNANGFIFDGFPRTTAQAQALDNLLAHKNVSITMMVALEVDTVELTRRLLVRGHESGRADDQNEEVIKNRINEYNNKTAPLKNYYSQQSKFHSVYGIGSVDQIFELLSATIDNKTKEKEAPLNDGIPTIADVNLEDEPAKNINEESVLKSSVAEKKVIPKKAIVQKPKVVTTVSLAKEIIKPAKKESKKAEKKQVATKKKEIKKSAPKKAAKNILKKTVKPFPKKAIKKALVIKIFIL
jgi:adenylate kinase